MKCDHCSQEVADLEPISVDGEDQLICEECDSNFVYCWQCQCYHYDELTMICRHLVWIEDWGEFGGCGINREEWNTHQESFMKLLDFLDAAVKEEKRSHNGNPDPNYCHIIHPIDALLYSVQNHRYFHFFVSTIFVNCYWYFGLEIADSEDYGHLFKPLLEEEQSKFIVGMAWLISLWSVHKYFEISIPDEQKTIAADIKTAEWIETWIGKHPNYKKASFKQLIK